jgi:hypothetical protein
MDFHGMSNSDKICSFVIICITYMQYHDKIQPLFRVFLRVLPPSDSVHNRETGSLRIYTKRANSVDNMVSPSPLLLLM